MFQHTAARRRLDVTEYRRDQEERVSTHSRPKAAGQIDLMNQTIMMFQHTAARRRLA